MKQIAIIITFLLIPLKGLCDTIDYWNVYINDSLVAKYDEYSEDLTLKLDINDIKKGDKITIRYFTDTPCIDCDYRLSVKNANNQKLKETSTRDNFGKLTFSLFDFIDVGKTNNNKEYLFNFFKCYDNGESNHYRHVLTLTFY